MKKFLHKTISVVLIVMLCFGLNAQTMNPVKNLTGNCSNNGKVTLNWAPPDIQSGDGFWLSYSSENIYGTIGTGSEGEVMSVARFTASDLTTFGVTAGDKIVMLQFALNKQGCSNLTMKVWQGGSFLVIPIINLVIANPGTEMVDERVNLEQVGNGWSTFALKNPPAINLSSELWFGYSVYAEATAYPLSYDEGPRISNKSDIINFGDQWTTLYLATQQEYSLNACIKAFVSKNDIPQVVRYEIYKDDVKIDQTTSNTFTIDGMMPGQRNFCVVAVYDNGESSAKVCSTITCNEVCETVPEIAVVYSDNCDKATILWTAPGPYAFQTNYNVFRDGVQIAGPIEETLFVDVTFDKTKATTWSVETACLTLISNKVNIDKPACSIGVNEYEKNAVIYPNPASRTVTIQFQHFKKVEIYNPVGQLVKISHTPTVDVSSYNSGLYFFKLFDSDNNVVNKRVSVIK
jgi:hypothetical protein